MYTHLAHVMDIMEEKGVGLNASVTQLQKSSRFKRHNCYEEGCKAVCVHTQNCIVSIVTQQEVAQLPKEDDEL